MKKCFLLFGLAVCFIVGHSQGDYLFTQKTHPYAQISGAGKVSPANFLSGQNTFGYQLPFDLKVKDIVTDRFIVTSGGEIQLLEKGKSWGPFLVPFSAIMEDYFGDGGVYGVLLGDTGKRMIGLEYRNLELMLDTGMNIINFQVWMFEEDNSIEFRYNTSEIIKGTSYTNGKGPVVGILDVEETTYANKRSYFLTGTPQSPVYHSATIPGKSSDTVPYMLGNITKNTVYRFQPQGTSSNIQKIAPLKPGLVVYPNPTSGEDIKVCFTTIRDQKAVITLMSIDGRIIYTAATNNNKFIMPTTGLAKGIYFIKVECNGFAEVEKVLVE